MNLTKRIHQHFIDSANLKLDSVESLSPLLEEAARSITKTLLSGHKVLACGNGGSAADAQHFSGEMLNRFEVERPGLPAIALTTDSSTLTAIANDYSYQQIFSRQIHALGSEGDLLLAISTSGNSKNILCAIEAAQEKKMATIALTGKDGGQCAELLLDKDIEIRVESASTPRIQEVHILCLHVICDLIDHLLGAAS